MRISGQGLDCRIDLAEPDHEGWMPTAIDINAPAFKGSFSCTIDSEDWKGFIRALQQLEASLGKNTSVWWGNMEANLEFRFELHPSGSLEVTYRFSPENIGLGPTLSGTFTADQTFIRDWLRSAEQESPNTG